MRRIEVEFAAISCLSANVEQDRELPLMPMQVVTTVSPLATRIRDGIVNQQGDAEQPPAAVRRLAIGALGFGDRLCERRIAFQGRLRQDLPEILRRYRRFLVLAMARHARLLPQEIQIEARLDWRLDGLCGGVRR